MPPGCGQHLCLRVLRHIVEKIDVFVLVVQILDLPVPQMVDAVLATQRTLEQIGGHDVEQLVEVPKPSTQTQISVRAFVPEPSDGCAPALP